MKPELKWTIVLLLILFPLLALLLLKTPLESEVITIEKVSDTLIKAPEIYEEDTEDTIIEAYMTPDGRYPKDYFAMPVDYDAFLSGTFGELRSNHFHSGIDIRTGGVEGQPIYAAADGFVSRINVATKGYGKALYITHPNGYTTVYAHLQKFNKDLQFFVKKHQYAQKSYETELFPEKGLLAVKKGDIIAYSGNTGGSAGPHLHFEIRKSSTQEALNPLLFGLPIKDNLAPEILILYLYQINSDLRAQFGTYPFVQHNTSNSQLKNRSLTIKLPPGNYGSGAFMKDYFRARSENLGINYSTLFVNGKSWFDCKIEKINFNTTRFINTHMDFCVHRTDNRKAQKFFKDDGNRLDFYSYSSHKGIFELKDTLRLKFIASDLAGGKDSLSVVLIADSAAVFSSKTISSINQSSDLCKVFVPGKSLLVGNAKARILMPGDALYFNYSVCLKEGGKAPAGSVSSLWNFADVHVPVHVNCEIAIKADSGISSNLYNKLLLVEWYQGKKYPIGGQYKAGFVEAKTRDFGQYFVAIDTTAPTIKPLKFNQQSVFEFSISDNLSGIKSYSAYIDNKWLLMEFEPKTGLLKGKWEDENPQGKHSFKLLVKDERGNQNIYEKEFTNP